MEYAASQPRERPSANIEQLIAEDDWVAVRTTWHGGTAGPSGMEAIALYYLADGNIVQQHSQLGQMGVLEPATQFAQRGD